MLIDVNVSRNTEVTALSELGPIVRAKSMIVMMLMVRLLWKMAAAAERMDSSGCWSACVYDAYNTQQGLGPYLLPVVGRYMVDCLGSARAYISPFYVLSNLLQIWIPPLIYEWTLLPVVLQEGDFDKGIWLAFCPFHN